MRGRVSKERKVLEDLFEQYGDALTVQCACNHLQAGVTLQLTSTTISSSSSSSSSLSTHAKNIIDPRQFCCRVVELGEHMCVVQCEVRRLSSMESDDHINHPLISPSSTFALLPLNSEEDWQYMHIVCNGELAVHVGEQLLVDVPFLNTPQQFEIGPAAQFDADLCRVCLMTGDAGRDATTMFPSFPTLLGERWVLPYTRRYPELCFVLRDQHGVCGYVLGAESTQEFFHWAADEYFPQIDVDRRGTPSENELLEELKNPTLESPDLPPNYAHLHIDLIWRAVRQGQGTAMIKTLLAALQKKGSPGVWLEMAASNVGALKFYQKIGFQVAKKVEETLYLKLTFGSSE